MPYLTRKTPRSSFMTNMFGMSVGDDTTATTTSVDWMGVPIVQFPGQPAPSSTSTPLSTYATYALYALGGLVAYSVLFGHRKKR